MHASNSSYLPEVVVLEFTSEKLYTVRDHCSTLTRNGLKLLPTIWDGA